MGTLPAQTRRFKLRISAILCKNSSDLFLDTLGAIAEFPIPTASSYPNNGIVAGPDGNLWFTEYYGDKIGRIARDTSNEFISTIVGQSRMESLSKAKGRSR